MIVSDSYISISTGYVSADESKDFWVTGPSGPPNKTYLSALASEPAGTTSIFARINEYVDGLCEIESADFYIQRPAQLTEDEYTILGVSKVEASFA
jgi:hypothetical protein